MPGLRIARPFASLSRAERIYHDAFELSVFARFHDHDGFSGARLEPEEPDRHFECTLSGASGRRRLKIGSSVIYPTARHRKPHAHAPPHTASCV
ncbi:hypothetical protein [Burkholderia diffusa]|uniref:hypothetical protein n=1 Tax=Burkholderia diffusa TaxID=488732 RepID=UPI000A9A5AA9|nr:hypothetical protein [Burkholderia diffusa]